MANEAQSRARQDLDVSKLVRRLASQPSKAAQTAASSSKPLNPDAVQRLKQNTATKALFLDVRSTLTEGSSWQQAGEASGFDGQQRLKEECESVAMSAYARRMANRLRSHELAQRQAAEAALEGELSSGVQVALDLARLYAAGKAEREAATAAGDYPGALCAAAGRGEQLDSVQPQDQAEARAASSEHASPALQAVAADAWECAQGGPHPAAAKQTSGGGGWSGPLGSWPGYGSGAPAAPEGVERGRKAALCAVLSSQKLRAVADAVLQLPGSSRAGPQEGEVVELQATLYALAHWPELAAAEPVPRSAGGPQPGEGPAPAGGPAAARAPPAGSRSAAEMVALLQSTRGLQLAAQQALAGSSPGPGGRALPTAGAPWGPAAAGRWQGDGGARPPLPGRLHLSPGDVSELMAQSEGLRAQAERRLAGR